MDFKVYVFSSNRYVLTGIQTTIRWKDLVKYPYFGIKKILLLNTIPSFDKWPIPAGEVTVTQQINRENRYLHIFLSNN